MPAKSKSKKSQSLSSIKNLIIRSWETYNSHRRAFLSLTGLYIVTRLFIAGFPDLITYQTLRSQLGSDGGYLLNAVPLISKTIDGIFSPSYNEVQSFLVNVLVVLFWLSMVWLLRQLTAGNDVTVRESLYNSMTPLVPFLIVVFIIFLEILPAAAGSALISYVVTGAFGFWPLVISCLVGGLLIASSIFLLLNSVLALIIVTLPNTYPIAAFRAAKQVVEGRRLWVLTRLAIFPVIIALLWIPILLPFVGLENLLVGVPLVPLVAELLAGISLSFSVVFLYLVYRELI